MSAFDLKRTLSLATAPVIRSRATVPQSAFKSHGGIQVCVRFAQALIANR
jgi:hypothetical protein